MSSRSGSGESTDDWFPLAELIERLAALVWVEKAMADLLDGWSRIEAHDRACAVFARAAAHHRWHADTIAGIVPTSPRLAEAATPHPPTSQWQAAIASLAELDAPDRTATRLAALVRELNPWLARETAALVDCAQPIADSALVRWLRFIEIDHHDDGSAVAELLNTLATNTVDMRDYELIASIELTTRAEKSAQPD